MLFGLQVGHLELPPGVSKERREVAEALGIAEPHERAVVDDRPVVPLAAERVPWHNGVDGRARFELPESFDRARDAIDSYGRSGGGRMIEEFEHVTPIPGPSPPAEHARVLVLRVGQQGSRPQARVRADRRSEVVLGLVPGDMVASSRATYSDADPKHTTGWGTDMTMVRSA